MMMSGKSSEKELVRLYEVAKKAADQALGSGNGGDSVEVAEDRCLDALKLLKDFPVNFSLLKTTQVGKHIRGLMKHPRVKIRSKASDLLEIWKSCVMEETTNGKKTNNVEVKTSTEVEISYERQEVHKMEIVRDEKAAKVEKVSKPAYIKVEKVEKIQDIKAERVIHEKKEVVINKKAGSSSVVPPKPTSIVKCNDATRNKIRQLLADAFLKVFNEAGEDVIDEVNASDPNRVAVHVESVMFENLGPSGGPQKVKYRSIMFNLKDGNNPDLRRRVLLGEIEPGRLISMSAEEMASDQRKSENKQIKAKAMLECERGGPPKATTDQFKCGRCGQRKTTYYQLQTRSADEPMTTFVTCVNCNNHWKFC